MSSNNTTKTETNEALEGILDGMGIPNAYGKFDRTQGLPFAVILGAGQQRFFSDNTVYSKKNDFTLEYYFRKKNYREEDQLENELLDAGFVYGKSEDVYIDDEKVFVIYYTLWRKQYE